MSKYIENYSLFLSFLQYQGMDVGVKVNDFSIGFFNNEKMSVESSIE